MVEIVPCQFRCRGGEPPLKGIRPPGPAFLVVAQRQPARVQRLDDLVDGLLAEVRDRGQLALGLRDEVADGLDARALEAVVGPDAELELLDEDVVHRALARGAGAVDAGHLARVQGAAGPGPELLDAVGVGEDRQLRDQDLGGLAQGGLRVDRPVGLDVERELVVVGALADAGLLDRVSDAADGREDRVDRDDADRLVGGLVVLRRAVAAATADRHVHLELGLLLERGDVHVGVEDLDAGGQVDVLRGDLTGAGDHERRLDLGGVGVHPADDALEVQDDVGDVLRDALDRRELVGDALDPDARHGRTGQRGQQHAAQRVAERVAEAAVKGLDHERAAMLLDGFAGDARDLEVEHWEGLVLRRGARLRLRGSCRASRAAVPPRWSGTARVVSRVLLGVQLDDELLLHGRRDLTTVRLAQHLRRQAVVVGLQPRGDLGGELGRVADDRFGAGPDLDGQDVALADLVAGGVHAAAVDGPVAVADHLARLAARRGEAEAHDDVVQARLQEHQQVLTRDARLAGRLVVVAAELALQHAVVAAGLLLLAQLDAVLRLLLATTAVISGRVGAALDAALVGEAALALEEQLLTLAAALLALGAGVT